MQAAVGPAFACNVVHIVPVMKPDPDDPTSQRLLPTLEFVTPDISDVEFEHGRLRVLTYDLDTKPDDPRRRMRVDKYERAQKETGGALDRMEKKVSTAAGRVDKLSKVLGAAGLSPPSGYPGGRSGARFVRQTKKNAASPQPARLRCSPAAPPKRTKSPKYSE